MAGTDSTKTPVTGGPAVILVEPQLGENIGTAARAMLNCGLVDLRLVRPRDGWPNPSARPSAAGADSVLDSARLFDDTAAAVADLTVVYATTARPRDMVKPVLTPRAAAAEMRGHADAGRSCGLLFGGERSGLSNEDISLVDAVVTAPLNPAFTSLNLAQAVLMAGYEWYQAGDATPDRSLPLIGHAPATKAQMHNFLEHLETELSDADFFLVPAKRPHMVRSIRNLFLRAQPTDQEVRTLHGIVTALSGRRKGGKPRGRG